MESWLRNRISRIQVFEWLKEFSESRELIEHLHSASRRSTFVNDENIENVKETVLEDRRVVIK